jgi:hypothetical protein
MRYRKDMDRHFGSPSVVDRDVPRSGLRRNFPFTLPVTLAAHA